MVRLERCNKNSKYKKFLWFREKPTSYLFSEPRGESLRSDINYRWCDTVSAVVSSTVWPDQQLCDKLVPTTAFSHTSFSFCQLDQEVLEKYFKQQMKTVHLWVHWAHGPALLTCTKSGWSWKPFLWNHWVVQHLQIIRFIAINSLDFTSCFWRNIQVLQRFMKLGQSMTQNLKKPLWFP